MQRFLSPRICWTAAAGYTLLLTYLLAMPDPWWFLGRTGDVAEKAVDNAVSGYLQHGITYFVLGFLLAYASHSGRGPSITACVMFAVVHGLCFEALHHVIPLRTFDIYDAVANTIGACCGALTVQLPFPARP